MPVAAYINDALGLRVHRYRGAVKPAELGRLADFYEANRPLVRLDVISLIDEGVTDTSALLSPQIDCLRARFRELHVGSDFVLLRRSAWVCPNRAAWTMLEAWLHDRHSRDGQGSEVCLVASLAAIDCLFEVDEIAAVAEWRGFRDLTAIAA